MQLVRFGFMRSGVRVLLKGKDGKRDLGRYDFTLSCYYSGRQLPVLQPIVAEESNSRSKAAEETGGRSKP